MPPKLMGQRKQSLGGSKLRGGSLSRAMTISRDDDDFVDSHNDESREGQSRDSDQEISVTLTTEDPNTSSDRVTFSYKDQEYKKINLNSDHLAVHFCTSGDRLKAPPSTDESTPTEITNAVKEHKTPTSTVEKAKGRAGRRAAGVEPIKCEEIAAAVQEVTPEMQRATAFKALSNEFNFSERRTQTIVRGIKVKEVQTEPPITSNFSTNVTQWDMYDYYTKQAASQATGKPKEAEKLHLVMPQEPSDEIVFHGLQKFKTVAKKMNQQRVNVSLRIIERMIHQNTYDEISQDFKYWEDASDDFRGGQGTLLPLWKFLYEATGDLSVTGIEWSEKFDDLFIVSYGSYDFLDQKSGFLCVFSLSNPSHPEHTFPTSSGVMCVAIHPDVGHLVAVGLYDGNVAVYNLQKAASSSHAAAARICQSDPWHGKHAEPVWKVQWQKREDMDGNFSFFSASGDGRLTHWTVVKQTRLRPSDVLTLKPNEAIVEELALTWSTVHVEATAFHFHPEWVPMFVIGSDDGQMVRCNRSYTQGCLLHYQRHDEAVHAIQWNSFHPRIFISCSPDSTVKIWDYELPDPVCCYHLGSPVTDVKWAPYSATVFAAVTSDGKVHVYDLFFNKYHPICVQVIVPKKNTRLTSLDFSRKYPVLLVGDNRGCVRCLKLSPNLRKSMAIPDPAISAAEEGGTLVKDQEAANLEKCLSVLRDPNATNVVLN